MRRFSAILALAFMTTCSLVLAGCGGGGEGGGNAGATASSSSAPKAITVKLSANDQMQFDKKEFKVPAGAQVTLEFTHTGKMDIKVMGHNVVILNKGVDENEFGNAAIKNGGKLENDYLPESMRDDRVIAHTKVIGGGQSTSVTFTAPPAGEYPFECTFPGHHMVMNGIMTSK